MQGTVAILSPLRIPIAPAADSTHKEIGGVPRLRVRYGRGGAARISITVGQEGLLKRPLCLRSPQFMSTKASNSCTPSRAVWLLPPWEQQRVTYRVLEPKICLQMLPRKAFR
ncbi:hypothetical protein CB1_000349018 [Camelus ferus]|nr:hypothetical protein CB1_000349018 [Camelus ferus]